MQNKVEAPHSLWFEIPHNFGIVEFPPNILKHFRAHQQTNPQTPESGGQLFWKPSDKGHKIVASITGPRPSDRRSRNSYKADHKQELIEIDEHYEKGLFFLGDWHTHPEAEPKPSISDIYAANEIFTRSENRGDGFLLVIIGNRNIEDSICAYLINGKCTTAKRI